MSFKGADFLHHEQFLEVFPGKAVDDVISTPTQVQIKYRRDYWENNMLWFYAEVSQNSPESKEFY